MDHSEHDPEGYPPRGFLSGAGKSARLFVTAGKSLGGGGGGHDAPPLRLARPAINWPSRARSAALTSVLRKRAGSKLLVLRSSSRTCASKAMSAMSLVATPLRPFGFAGGLVMPVMTERGKPQSCAVRGRLRIEKVPDRQIAAVVRGIGIAGQVRVDVD